MCVSCAWCVSTPTLAQTCVNMFSTLICILCLKSALLINLIGWMDGWMLGGWMSSGEDEIQFVKPNKRAEEEVRFPHWQLVLVSRARSWGEDAWGSPGPTHHDAQPTLTHLSHHLQLGTTSSTCILDAHESCSPSQRSDYQDSRHRYNISQMRSADYFYIRDYFVMSGCGRCYAFVSSPAPPSPF